jgi:hypothetical protein
MQQSDPTERFERIERSIEALASTAAEFFGKLADRQAQHETRMAEIEAKHQARLNEHKEALLDHEEEHRRLLRAQVLIADDLRETAALQRETTEKLNGLIAFVDGLIRKQPKQ